MMRSARWVYGLLVLASVVYCTCLFSDIFGGQQQWGRGDWDQFTFRFATPRTAILRDGQLPLWNPYVNGGNVLLAHPHCPAFSPWYLLTLALGAPLGLRVGVVLFVASGSTGMAALLRRWGVSPAGCCLGGVVLMMSAHFTMHITEGHLEWCVLGLIPWVVLCLLRAEDDWRFVIVGALVLASGWLYGSIYMVAIFVPLLGIWAALESLRTRRRHALANYTMTMGLTLMLCAVALLPRMEFLRANPRKTELHEQIAPAMLGEMLLDPGQADLYRRTRDVRNPAVDELIRLLPGQTLSSATPYETLKWHRLEITLQTTSDWSDVSFEDLPHLWFYEGRKAPDKTPARLNSLSRSGQGLSIKNPHPGELATAEATVYLQLPPRGKLKFIVNRGYGGASRLVVTRRKKVLLDAIHADAAPGGSYYWHAFFIPRQTILSGGSDGGSPTAPWYRLDAALKTTADWCKVEVVNCPHLFQVESPQREAAAGSSPNARLATTTLNVDNRRPGEAETVRRAKLYVQVSPDGDLRVATTQGPAGKTSLTLSTPQGKILETTRVEATESGGEKTRDYTLSGELVARQLQQVASPMRWRLDELGMTYDWHEYGSYVTWLALATAVVGLGVSFRRHWPLVVAGVVAGLVAMGDVLPLNFWALWKLLPMYQSLQVPSRFLVAVVFVSAICSGFGVDRIGRWIERLGGVWLRRLLECGVVLAVYLELTVLSWTMFSEIFVCPKRPVPGPEGKQFAQRYAEDDVRYAAMYSAHYPYLQDNSGVLREYENIAVKRGKIRLADDPDYRGEAYLEGSHGKAQIVDWTMSRVRVAVEVEAADRLVLNQNYFPGWKAICCDDAGKTRRLRAKGAAEGNSQGLVSIDVAAGDREIEFYYRPNGFIWGAVISGLTLLGCLTVLAAGRRGGWGVQNLPRLTAGFMACRHAIRRRPVFGYLAAAVALNCPFLLCHPGWTLIEAPLVRSLAVNLVLFLLPGVPLIGAMIGRGWLPRFQLLWAMIASLGVFVAVLVTVHLTGLAVTPSITWNATWLITNLAIVLSASLGGPPDCGLRFHGRSVGIGLLTFAAAYFAFFYGATRIVPVMDDHDYETQGTAHALLTQLEMRLLTDRKTVFCYAHPPLVHACVAGSFLYYAEQDDLAYYDQAWERVHAAEQGESFQPVVNEFLCIAGEERLVRTREPVDQRATLHRIIGIEGKDYLVEPPLSPLPPDRAWQGGSRISVRDMEVQMLYDHFRRNTHHRLATRTTNVFLAALTVGLLGWWIARMTAHQWLGLLVPLCYATNPEVFVRSCYGGYFAASNFILVHILLAVERQTGDRSRSAWTNCLLAGGFAALANHKLVLLPVALVVWELIRLRGDITPKRVAAALLHPMVIGFAAGTMVFWAYGLAVSPKVFWLEHVRYHLADRLVHYNPLGYGLYPTLSGLWLEFWQHTGYVLLPLGIASLALLCRPQNGLESDAQAETTGWRGWAGLWAIWFLLTAVAFSLIDWRQTKHLMPLMLPLHLAPVRWVASKQNALVLVGIVFAGLLVWNIAMLNALAGNFDTFSITPAW